MSQPLISVNGVAKHFQVGRRFGLGSAGKSVVKAVDGVDLALDRGKTLALVGESGCGKTTLARMILRLDRPTEGSIEFDGKSIHELGGSDLKRFRMRVQGVFQNPWASLDPRMRIRRIVSEALVVNQTLTRAEVRAKVEAVLKDVGLSSEHLNNYPHEFSGGQRQRIAVASALICDPDVVVLDEPVSALDVSIRAQILTLLEEMQKRRNVSYILIAHDLGTTRYMADVTAVMYLGRIVEIGNTEQVFSTSAHPYTRALFSAALPAHPDEISTETVLSGEVPSPVNPPSGCPFHTRCPEMIGERCKVERPQLQVIGHGVPPHMAACHLHDQ